MNSYEGMFVFRPDSSKEVLDKVLSQVREVLEKNTATTDVVKEWGRQKLAYPIKKYREGIYYLINFHIEPDAISRLKRSFGLNESILRLLIVKDL